MKGDDIAERLLDLGAAVIATVAKLRPSRGSSHLAGQLVRCGTAGGAHYEEARGAESRADFIHKVRLAAKELRETTYWLELARRTGLLAVDVADLCRESTELAAILAASAKTATSRR